MTVRGLHMRFSTTKDLAMKPKVDIIMLLHERDQAVRLAAQHAHNVNRAYCAAMGDHSHSSWEDTPFELQHSVMQGVQNLLLHPTMTPAESHAEWRIYKMRQGWKYGPKKDVQAKTHPNMVDYDDLPESEKAKDAIFIASVWGFLDAFTEGYAAGIKERYG